MPDWKRKSDTYVKIYEKYRNKQDDEIAALRTQVRALTQMVEFLCKKVFE